jgi:threonine dehydratase
MADPSTCPPLTPASIAEAYTKIKTHIHRTPLITSSAVNAIASSPNPSAYLAESPPPFPSFDNQANGTNGSTASPVDSGEGVVPRFRLWFKCENFQKIGAFKARGAFHAVTRLIDMMGLDEVRRRGVVTHSSGKELRRLHLMIESDAQTGNHAQALALAASHFRIPSYIVMPKISTPSKIAGTRIYTPNVIFSGSTSQEREAVVADVIQEKGAILVPPYDHPDIILGQGTSGLEMEEQFLEAQEGSEQPKFDAVMAPLGGGGLLSGVATHFSSKPETLVFGAEPSFQGGDDGRRGLLQGKRIEHVKTLTIADGLRTPVGVTNWSVVSDRNKVEGVYAASEDEIKAAMKFVYERMKVVVEPSGCVPLAVVLFNKEFREMVAARQKQSGKACWDMGIVFSGGNTTMKALSALFAEDEDGGNDEEAAREEGVVGMDGSKQVEDVAG